MEIIRIPIDDLTPDPNNAKTHPKWQIEQIINSIEQFGNLDPIGVWGDDNLIVEGHGRYLALKELGYNEVEAIRLDWLTEEERKAYALVHNKTTMNSDFDSELLDLNLEAIGEINMSLFGFDLEAPDEIELPPIQEDNAPDDAPTRSHPGDIWQLGDHRLICGDCTDLSIVQKLMDGAEADLLVTDPPYNVELGKDMTPEEAKLRRRRTDGLTIQNDSFQSDDDFCEFLVQFYKTAFEVMKPGAAFYIWHSDTKSYYFRKALIEAGGTLRQILIWNKSSLIICRQDYQWKHESCLYGWKDGAGHYFIDSRKQSTVFEDEKPDFSKMKKEEMRALLEEIYSDRLSTTVIDEQKPSRSEFHPTMKPVKLIARQIMNSSKKGDKVLDVFGGSGTTLIACEQLDRVCYMSELDTHYCDVIIKRWEDFTGREAVLLNGNK